jgi:5-oxoprolinase (ATP-hydrolysing)
VIDRYVERIESVLGGRDGPGARAGLHLMTSAGGLVRAGQFRPKDSLLSGPAGGVVGAAAAGLAAGFRRTIAFDMGGTSTDVSRYDGEHALAFEHEVGGVSIVAPALAIESVAAGGGSICRTIDGSLCVGPQSAGASPGPACYGAGGPLTITDCNLLLGRLDPAGFGVPIDPEASRRRLKELLGDLEQQTGREHDADDALESLIRIADERMAEAIARVSIREGYNPAEYALVCFGGAGGQHAAAIAERLGIRTVVVPPDAGLLSALGLGAAGIERIAERQVLRPLDDTDLAPIVHELVDRATDEVMAQGADRAGVAIARCLVTLRLHGQETGLAIERRADDDVPALTQAFRARYTEVYGHPPPERKIEIEAVRVVARQRATSADFIGHRPSAIPRSSEVLFRRIRVAGGWMDAALHRRTALRVGASISGPALVLEDHTTTLVPSGWSGLVHVAGALVLTRQPSAAGPAAVVPTTARNEISTGRLLSIARDMGEMLRRTALSTNVKERLDFSCAILDGEGQLVVNAPHIPVHLGSLGVCVRRLRESLEIGPGDVVVTNHPGFGGSHLPDVTVVTPVFAGGRLIAFTACRAHHAEIGGARPGSMPTEARTLLEEGVVIPPTHLVRAGEGRWDHIDRLLRAPPYPSRAPAENLADLRAQVAANHHGATSLRAFAADVGAEQLRAAMDLLTDRAARGAQRAIAALTSRGCLYQAEERLDDGSALRVSMTPSAGRLSVDFAGCAPLHPGNLNATPAIVRATVIYVLRLLIDEPLPLNEGLLRNVDISIPRGMLNPDFPSDVTRCPAVAGGNVETSQRLVDTLIKALGLAACSQGTMNNTLFGTDRFGYYETVCGGAGAGPGFDGASAVHTHMTNTRITDPELLEHRYPVRLERFAIRRGSGGAGRHRGGDGVTREMSFLAPCSLSVLTQHRAAGPYGLAGGAAGQTGSQRLVRTGGRIEPLAPIDGLEVAPGDRLILHTPGGGGWGAPD